MSGSALDAGPASVVLLQAATLLAEDLRDRVVELPTGSIRWPTAAAFELATAPPPVGSPIADGFWDLYSGNPGVAPFLAAFSQATGDQTYRDLCLRALEPVRCEALGAPTGDPTSTAPETIGALVGTSSWIYALLVAGKLLHDPRLLRDAHEISALITPDRILADRHHDLVFGSAGALLVLLALDAADPTPNPRGDTPLGLAQLCARQILSALPAPGAAAPDVTPRQHRLGLSHGFAGMGLALSRLYRRTREPEIGSAALRLLARAAEAPRSASPGPAAQAAAASWCHGAAGLSVALSGILDCGLDDRAVAGLGEALQQAVDRMRRAPFSPQDHLCCGNMGRVAALAYLAEQTDDPALFAAACQHAQLVLRVAKTRKGFSLDYDRPDASFFRGSAGIAYTLLGLASPRTLPWVIALE